MIGPYLLCCCLGLGWPFSPLEYATSHRTRRESGQYVRLPPGRPGDVSQHNGSPVVDQRASVVQGRNGIHWERHCQPGMHANSENWGPLPSPNPSCSGSLIVVYHCSACTVGHDLDALESQLDEQDARAYLMYRFQGLVPTQLPTNMDVMLATIPPFNTLIHDFTLV